jgi:hypothetical protein
MKNYVLVLFFVLFPVVAWSYDFTDSQGIAYSITSYPDKTVEVSSGVPYSGSVVIPSTALYNGITYTVTGIGFQAFAATRGVTSVTIPNTVTRIERGAFSGCFALSSIRIPASVTYIGLYAFDVCPALTALDIDSANPSYAVSDGVLFNKDYSTLIAFPGGKTALTYAIPNTVKIIGDNAFNQCYGLKSVQIPSSVTTIGNSAFANCNFTSIDLPSSVVSLGISAFSGSGLTSITIPSSVTSIGYDQFLLCRNLTSINVEAANPNYSSVNGVLFDKTQTTLLAYPSGNSATSYTIPPTVQRIENSAFDYSKLLMSVTIPASVKAIGSGAFMDCARLSSVTIPLFVSSIESFAFANCPSLTNITIPSSVTSIANGVFSECPNLSAIHLLNANPVDLSGTTDVFRNVPTSTCILYVPTHFMSSYKSAPVWKDFANMTEEDPICSIDSSATTLSGLGESKNIALTTSIVWTAKSDQNWVTITPSSGVGDATLSVTSGINPTVQSRAATVTIYVNDINLKSFTVTQNPGPPTLSVSVNSASVKGKEGGSGSVSFTSNTTWSASASDTWLTLSQSSGTGNGELIFTASKNLSETSRTATVTISVSGCPDQVISVTQDPYIIASIIKKWNNVLICNNKTKQFASYQWYKNDTPISGATKQYYEENGALSGNYYVKVMTTDNIEGQSNIYKSASSAKVMLYPNPTSSLQQSRLRIDLPASNLTNARLVILALSGQLVFESKALSTDIVLPTLKPGSYIVRIEPENEDVYIEKLVVY